MLRFFMTYIQNEVYRDSGFASALSGPVRTGTQYHHL